MGKCDDAYQDSLNDETIVGWVCYQCEGTGDNQDGNARCQCCNGRGNHTIIRPPKPKQEKK